jgi:hypothetical protein
VKKKPRNPPVYEACFRKYCTEEGVSPPVAELVFAPPRKWRFDYAWPDYKVALEVEGGAWTGGRHTRGSGFMKDIEKYNEASCLGWRLIRTVPSEMTSVAVIQTIKRAIEATP